MRGSIGRATLALCLLWSAFGCGATLQDATSGEIGCAQSDIRIYDDEATFNSRTWVATCHDRTFYCTGLGGRAGGISCKEDVAAQPVAAPTASAANRGCQSDDQCKGERLCKRGECVDPG
jgi:hypothetical protein